MEGEEQKMASATVYFNPANQNYSVTTVKGSLSFEEDGIKIVKEARAAQAAFGMLGAVIAGQGDTTTIRYQDIASVARGNGAHISDGVILRLRSGETVEIKPTGLGAYSPDEIVTQVQKKLPTTAACCPYCGAELEPGYIFCSNCGARLDNTPSIPDTTAEPQSSVQLEGSQPSPSYAAQHTEQKDQGSRIVFIVVGIILVIILRSCANAML